MELDYAAKQLEALGNPTRLRIFRELVRAGESGLPVGEIQAILGVPGSTLSHHITRLVACGLLTQERQGRVLVCTNDYHNMNALLAFLRENCCERESVCPA